MEIIVRATDKLVTLEAETGAVSVPARIWQGVTSTGIPVHCYITRIAVRADRPAHEHEQFERELQETAVPRAEVAAIPSRLIL